MYDKISTWLDGVAVGFADGELNILVEKE